MRAGDRSSPRLAVPPDGDRGAPILNIDRSAAALLIALPIAFNTFFFLLGRLFQRLRGVGWREMPSIHAPL